ncbi:class I SAM-dependent methyltransferase family protein [Natrinema thermotolerans]|uniref:Class I SAM-dependent methyltransferase family protein n=1 Tax=Natrinema thermotolerans TaxID=121872 RepID=A0AAF0T0Z5_9EURY|nr:class I SAM-dependent methyltransferase family protein [Natrinema thermotolerans]QCC59708.1 class I SAM-dependent methyltransferase family protein [Natrinema thermotolerans]WMT06692.1 class I SAM-dependent methyltransferase family protein [Natrinema thermotolerans]
MEVPCVRVAREEGEAVRSALADADLIDDDYEIAVEDGRLYIPVADPDAAAGVLEDGEVVSRSVAERDQQTTPADLLAFDPTYERLGRAALIDEDDPERARAIADAVLESDLPVETVLNKASKVKGETRVRDWELLAGENTEVVHREYGCEFLLDLAQVYFSPRLATERHRVAKQVSSDERAFDMFAGVGPFVIPFAKRGATCVGVDLNPDAIEYLRENAARNGVEERVTAINEDVREVATEYADWADRLVMNLPHSADAFLEAAVTLAGDDCTLHYYDIQHEDDPFGPGEQAIRAAAEPEYNVTVETRHTVRSYAPHELNVCLDVRLER